jgi:hypothetical protein
MTKLEFLSATDLETGEPMFLDVSLITSICQLVAKDDYPRRTVIRVGGHSYLVKEEALALALASGRGFLGPED